MYVGITRARKRLYLTRASERMLYNQYSHNPPSRFLKEIPARLEAAGDKKDDLLSQVKGLTHLQVNSLMNIEVFSSVRHANLAGRMKELLRRSRKNEIEMAAEPEKQREKTDGTKQRTNDTQ